VTLRRTKQSHLKALRASAENILPGPPGRYPEFQSGLEAHRDFSCSSVRGSHRNDGEPAPAHSRCCQPHPFRTSAPVQRLRLGGCRAASAAGTAGINGH
jgi:hypothetical protein